LPTLAVGPWDFFIHSQQVGLGPSAELFC
jgi:hypothetical protein